MEGHGPIASARRWLGEGERVAMATVIATWGSAPVQPGGQMAIASNSRFAGSVSGGCIEADVIAEAEEVMQTGRPKVLEFGVTDETAWRSGLACGGKLRVLIELLDGVEGRAHLVALAAAEDKRIASIVVTRLDTGQRRLYLETEAIPPLATSALDRRKCELITVDGVEMFVHVHAPEPQILIIGATHIAQALTELAKVVGYSSVVVDPRSAFTSADRFDPSLTCNTWPSDALPKLGMDTHTAVVTLTHVANIDDEALKLALRSRCRYIGALGSRKTHAERVARLKAAGFEEADMTRINAPVGLDIGAQTAPEIAIAILAQIVKAFKGSKNA